MTYHLSLALPFNCRPSPDREEGLITLIATGFKRQDESEIGPLQSASCASTLKIFDAPVDSSQELPRCGSTIELDAANTTWLAKMLPCFHLNPVIQAVVKKYDILFIADEVICAFGRVGTMFGRYKYGIKPDLVTLAKLSSIYMPIGAVLVSPKVYDVVHSQSNQLGVFSHGFTYSGHPVACAVALETLKIYKFIRGTGLIFGTEIYAET
ncbi:hypothetical protein CASFOL_037236 [Castilleja foliolosa]|uniref:Uncharacterized protein n=1 Tax=Castilleja foliolosa TaxID=1961234 RepID=A0ABD3BP70_9LAMI